MAYKVRLTSAARADAFAAFDYIRESAPGQAELWLNGLFTVIASLGELPNRCPFISESEDIRHPLRQILYGKRTGTYRIIFDIEDHSDEGQRVRVLRIWHGARDRLKPEDIGEE